MAALDLAAKLLLALRIPHVVQSARARRCSKVSIIRETLMEWFGNGTGKDKRGQRESESKRLTLELFLVRIYVSKFLSSVSSAVTSFPFSVSE